MYRVNGWMGEYGAVDGLRIGKGNASPSGKAAPNVILSKSLIK
jgi:hypothetical protein